MTMPRIVTALALLAPAIVLAANARAQEIDFDQINKFESVGKGTLSVGEPPKTIIDDPERHVVILTIWVPTPRPRFIGSRWTRRPPTLPEPRSYRGEASRLFKPRGCSSSRRLASPATKSNMATCCLG
jgi:hypothetical protein